MLCFLALIHQLELCAQEWGQNNEYDLSPTLQLDGSHLFLTPVLALSSLATVPSLLQSLVPFPVHIAVHTVTPSLSDGLIPTPSHSWKIHQGFAFEISLTVCFLELAGPTHLHTPCGCLWLHGTQAVATLGTFSTPALDIAISLFPSEFSHQRSLPQRWL